MYIPAITLVLQHRWETARFQFILSLLCSWEIAYKLDKFAFSLQLLPQRLSSLHCVRNSIRTDFSISTCRVQRSLATTRRDLEKVRPALYTCLSFRFCLPQGRKRDRIILCRFSCFPILDMVYAMFRLSRIACHARACNPEVEPSLSLPDSYSYMVLRHIASYLHIVSLF